MILLQMKKKKKTHFIVLLNISMYFSISIILFTFLYQGRYGFLNTKYLNKMEKKKKKSVGSG